MNNEIFSRTENLLGTEALEALKSSHVAVFGIGGVGGYVCEMLARTGVGTLSLFDSDKVSVSNRNRQIIALSSTTGRPKVEVMRERILDINPDATVHAHYIFYDEITAPEIDLSQYDFIADCIDTVSSKLLLITNSKACGTEIISAMGAGNKLDPTRFEVADIYKTSVCPLARTMRHELKKRGVKSLTVVYSKEEPTSPKSQISENGRHIPASVAFAPAGCGIVMAGEIVRAIIGYGD
ncbi:MAG: tRNA threonylcarbamoyladenosine dehydratase [Oscillospiraceae bacterium]|nr:tRNA threonylcarbamoyladenosine dehydratase [Oscillospiraceae bacterium]